MRCAPQAQLRVLLRERLQSGVSYNPLTARMAQDPYPLYATLRTRDPVHRSRLLNAWLFTRYSDVDAILRDHRHFGSDPRTGTLSPPAARHAASTGRVHHCCFWTRRTTRGSERL